MTKDTAELLPRRILEKLLAEVDKPFASVLIGPRQVGKTVLMKMIETRSMQPTTYLDMEQPDDALVLRDGLASLLAEIGTGERVLLLDEFHRIPDALALFKQIHDRHPTIKVYASGSSSIEIHSHLKQSAVGRVRRTRVFPFSFPEWCQPKTDLDLWSIDPTAPAPPTVIDRLNVLLDTFVIWGGMPELHAATGEMERREILAEICSLYLEKDVRTLLRDEEILRFNEFLRLVGIRLGQLMNRAAFGRELGLTWRKIDEQLKVMEHTFTLRLLTTDYSNPTKRLVKSPKIYWYDNGVRNALVRDFRERSNRPDGGALLENHVVCELDKSAGVDIEILFHRTVDRQEIDFVLERDRLKLLVELKASLGRRRIPRAIRDQLERDDAVGAVVLNDRFHALQEHEGKPVLFLPVVLAHLVADWFRGLCHTR